MTDSAQTGTHGRVPAWMVILCVLMDIVVAAMVISLPYYRQQSAIGYVKTVGEKIMTKRGGPQWRENEKTPAVGRLEFQREKGWIDSRDTAGVFEAHIMAVGFDEGSIS